VKGTTSLTACVPGQLPCAWAPVSAQAAMAVAAASVCRRLQLKVFFMRLVSVDLFG
jgi:hypothetical protein